MKLLITDLDNTLYDWVSYFAESFRAMAEELSVILGIPEDQLRSEFKKLHQKYGDSERPFTLLELPSVMRFFGDLPQSEVLERLEQPMRAFSEARKRTLHLYPSVRETLDQLKQEGVRLVGHTEAMAVNANYRLKYLGIIHFFTRLYALTNYISPHPRQEVKVEHSPSPDFVAQVPRDERKPNPKLLLDICAREGVAPADTWYVGDSLTRDMSMAKMAGVRAVWARYGTHHDSRLWDLLVSISHWNCEDIMRETELRNCFDKTEPDYKIDSFGELSELILQ